MFIVCGEALLDIFGRSQDSADDRLAMDGVPGGSPFNVAIGLARLGVPTGFLGGMSTDALGEALARRLDREGVSLRHVVRRPEPTTLSLVGLGVDGVPAYTFYGPGAEAAVTVADLPRLGPDIRGLHLGSYTLVAQPVGDALAALASRAKDRLVVLDPNVRVPIVADLGLWRQRITALLPHIGVVKASDEDLGLLWPGRHPRETAREWLACGPRLVVITHGAAGASAYTMGGDVAVARAPSVEVVDTVGAGDAFQAALIAGLIGLGVRDRRDVAAIQGDVLHRLLAQCAWAGALACTRRGADPPSRDELLETNVAVTEPEGHFRHDA